MLNTRWLLSTYIQCKFFHSKSPWTRNTCRPIEISGHVFSYSRLSDKMLVHFCAPFSRVILFSQLLNPPIYWSATQYIGIYSLDVVRLLSTSTCYILQHNKSCFWYFRMRMIVRTKHFLQKLINWLWHRVLYYELRWSQKLNNGIHRLTCS